MIVWKRGIGKSVLSAGDSKKTASHTASLNTKVIHTNCPLSTEKRL